MHRFACYIFDNILLVSYYHYLYVYVYVYQASSYPTTHTLCTEHVFPNSLCPHDSESIKVYCACNPCTGVPAAFTNSNIMSSY